MTRGILVADDNLTMQRTATELLAQEGVEVVTVGNGMAAIKKLSSFRPLVVLADADMPGKDGYEVCDFVKSSPALSHIRVLIAVSDVEPYDPQRGSSAGVDGIVKKPFDREELVSIIGRCLDEAETMNLQSLAHAPECSARDVEKREEPAWPGPVRGYPNVAEREESTAASLPDVDPAALPPSPATEGSLDSGEIPAVGALPEHESHYEKFVEALLAERFYPVGPDANAPPRNDLQTAEERSDAGRFPEDEEPPAFSAISDAESLEPEPAAASDSASISLPLVASVVHKVVAKMAPSPLSPEMVRDIEQRLTDEIISELAAFPSQT